MDCLALKRAIEEIAKGVNENMVFTRKVHGTLVSVSPLKFQLSEKIFIYGANCITPKYRVFREDEIGKSFVFQEDAEGQQFIYCYEATAKPGENGVPYRWKGTIDSCSLHGTCPHGAVVVTGGTIDSATHERGI
ncbi:MAG: hypothetical protein SOW18_06405 [Peptoniphilus sp.]|nr:hypothetical protein [Peptoniphilus sp.]MDY3119150.1 hypothetical protein [Peptoniphilus sp.]